jgi:hypothetical protein
MIPTKCEVCKKPNPTRIIKTTRGWGGAQFFGFCARHLPDDAIDLNGRIARWILPEGHRDDSSPRLLKRNEVKEETAALALQNIGGDL